MNRSCHTHEQVIFSHERVTSHTHTSRELVLLLGMLIRRFEESVVQVAVRAGWVGGGGGGGGRVTRGGKPLSTFGTIPLFFEEADRDWLHLYQALCRGEEGEGAEAAAGGGSRGEYVYVCMCVRETESGCVCVCV